MINLIIINLIINIYILTNPNNVFIWFMINLIIDFYILTNPNNIFIWIMINLITIIIRMKFIAIPIWILIPITTTTSLKVSVYPDLAIITPPPTPSYSLS